MAFGSIGCLGHIVGSNPANWYRIVCEYVHHIYPSQRYYIIYSIHFDCITIAHLLVGQRTVCAASIRLCAQRTRC